MDAAKASWWRSLTWDAPDHEMARRHGLSASTVLRARQELRIPAYQASAYRSSKHDDQHAPPEPVDKWASIGPTPVRVQSYQERVQPDAVTVPAPSLTKAPSSNGSVNSGLRRVLMFGDAHIPYHDRTAWEVFLRAAAAFRPDMLVCLGDMADVYSLSGYTADPSRPSKWEDELCAVNDELDRLDALGAEEKLFLGGNHEDRLPRYLAKRAPHLYESVLVPEVFRLEERGWHYVPHGQSAMVGKVMVTHDLDRYGIYAVRHALRDAGCNVVIGHIHRMCVWYEGSLSGNNQVAASFGWLGGTEWATYRHRVRAERDWAHGFGIGYLEPDGNMHMQAVPIINGACVVEGQVIR